MSAGRPRRLILEAREGLPDGRGGRASVWVEKGVHWARLDPRGGGFPSSEDGPVSVTRYRAVMRAVPFGALSRPAPGDRFREGARAFHVRSVIDDEGGGTMTCLVEEEVQP
ncbi:head-tail adaptor protein [Alphaproteobacteria bacterium GH1-50]|uniref:Head-tail adaptor protein n=1 Tax=Kangsaoukella pontilimi TaxID=2691042 RepID=A0A7C9J2M5_9RHOB|nr:head-tail adaptor protein [Kangsaoukella pontilimi]MXQ07641.1 head-tail adaptor protein [Kangsaoukella pontilimi]